MVKKFRIFIAQFMALLAFATSVGIKLYVHECLTCNVTDISLVDEVAACHEHHLIHHLNHVEEGCCDNHCGNCVNEDCCSSHEEFILYQFDFAPERSFVFSFKAPLVAEIQLHPDIVPNIAPEISQPIYGNFTNPPPLLKAGIDLIKSIHQFRYHCCFLS